MDTRYNLRKTVKTPTKVDLRPHMNNKKCKRYKTKKVKENKGVQESYPHFFCRSINVDIFMEFLAFDEELNEVAQAFDDC